MGRDVNRAVAARFITNAGAEAGFFIGMWGKAAYEFEGGPTALAVMTALIAVTSVVGNVIGGVLVDRLDARRVLIGAEVALVPAVLGLVLTNSLTSLFMVGAISFLLHGIEETAATSLPTTLTDPTAAAAADGDDPLVRVNARLEAAGWLAMVVGPAAGGVLAAVLAVDAVFAFDAATSIVSIALLLGIRTHSVMPDVAADGDEVEEVTGWQQTMAGLRIARRTPRIAFVVTIGALLWFAFGAFIALEPLYYRDVLGRGPEVIGYVNAVFGFGMFLGSVAVDRWGRRLGYSAAVWLAVVTGLGSIVYVGSASLWIVVVGAVVWSIPLGMIFPIIRTLAQRAAPAGMTGRVMGAIATAQNTASVLPAVFVPFLATAIGVQATLIGGGLMPVLALPLLLGRARRLDELRDPRPLDIAPDPQPGAVTPLP